MFAAEAEAQGVAGTGENERPLALRWRSRRVPFLLGRIDAAGLQAQWAGGRSEILLDRWQCQAALYIALQALREGDTALYRARMAACAASRYGPLEHEYYLARWEVDHSFPEPAFLVT